MEPIIYRGQRIEVITKKEYPVGPNGYRSPFYQMVDIIKINGRVVENDAGGMGTTPLDDAKEIIDRMLDSEGMP